MSEQGPELPRDLAEELRLRPERPPVTRLSRRVLMALVALATVSVCGTLIWALSSGQRKSTAATELYSTENKPTPDGLSALPRDYTGLPPNVPALGPPLLGDIGHPVPNVQEGPASIDADQQQAAQETEAASSPAFVRTFLDRSRLRSLRTFTTARPESTS